MRRIGKIIEELDAENIEGDNGETSEDICTVI